MRNVVLYEGEEAYFKVDDVPSARVADLIEKSVELSKLGTQLSVQEQAELKSLSVQQWVLSGPELIPVLNKFIALEGKNDIDYMRFAERFGFLGLCNKHGLPYKHPKWEIWDCGRDYNIERLVRWR